MKIQTAFVLLAAITSASAMGCGSSSDGSSKDLVSTTRASLHRAKGCTDLLVDLKADAVFKLEKGIDRQIEAIQKCITRNGDANCAYYGGYGGFGERNGGIAVDAAAEGASPPQAGAPTSGGAGNSSEEAPKASSYSETNTQVAGVDEADFVKTDGKNLYVLHGRAFKVLQAWPASELKELSSFDIEGTPSEMFVEDGKVVIYSQVNGAELFTAAGVTPKASYQDYGIAYGGAARTDAAIAPDIAPGGPGTGTPSQMYVPLTKITVLTLAGATPSVAREVYFEGGYLDSRRVGSHVRTVLAGAAHGPKLKYSVYELYPTPTYDGVAETKPAPGGEDRPATTPMPPEQTNPYPKTGTEMINALNQLRAENKAAIEASVITDWLPYTFVKNGSAVTAKSIMCEDFYVPTAGSTASGVTEVASIDLANPAEPPRETAILGHAQTVYGSANTLYLAAQAWIEPPSINWDEPVASSGGASGGSTGSAPPPATATPPSPGTAGAARPQTTPTKPVITVFANNATHVHKFDFTAEPSFPNYIASGTVLGSVKNQFSLDDREGYLRIATTEQRTYFDENNRYVSPTFPGGGAVQDRPGTVNHVFVLGVNGSWLDLVGDVGELAPNEQIYSVRFVDGRGYVVTFRQVDPLFVLDLTNPTAPTKLAELKIPGFSEYMHPLGANHILTIGRDASDEGRVRGLQLQIFDVTNGANPVLAQKYTYTNDTYGQSEATSNHKAFTYFADQKMLAFPYYSYGPQAGGAYGMESTLELFKVGIDTGFSKLGSIDHTTLVSKAPTGYCGGYYSPQVRRGVFLENFVYSISYGGVVVKDANNLAAAGTTLPLNAPLTNPGYGPQCEAF